MVFGGKILMNERLNAECSASIEGKFFGALVGPNVEPLDVWKSAKPSELALGESAGVDLDRFDGLGQAHLSVQISDDFLIA